jgi:hypothetical protein
MHAKQIVAAAAKSLEGIGAREAVDVANAPPPVGEVEVVLRPSLSQRCMP